MVINIDLFPGLQQEVLWNCGGTFKSGTHYLWENLRWKLHQEIGQKVSDVKRLKIVMVIFTEVKIQPITIHSGQNWPQIAEFLKQATNESVLKLLLCSLRSNFLMRRMWYWNHTTRQTSNIRCTSVGNIIVDLSDVVGASPVGAAPTTSSFST